MAVDTSDDVANGMLDSVETTVGTSPILRIRTGSKPANCAASRTGTILASMTLPSDWAAAAASRSKSKSGTWQDPSGDAAGTAAHFEIMDSGGTVCKMQGTVTATGGGGDMTLDNVVIAVAQVVTITSFTMTA